MWIAFHKLTYIKQENLKFLAWFVQCQRNYGEFAVRFPIQFVINTDVPSRNLILVWSKSRKCKWKKYFVRKPKCLKNYENQNQNRWKFEIKRFLINIWKYKENCKNNVKNLLRISLKIYFYMLNFFNRYIFY